VNEAAEIIHGVAHPDANIIFGAVIDDNMGDEVRVTVIAAGFERWEEGGRPAVADRGPSLFSGPPETVDIFAETTRTDDEFDLGDDDFDVPSFLR
jgi:cell division protein FtsZ